MKFRLFISVFAISLMGLASSALSGAPAQTAADATVAATARKYVPTAADRAYVGVTAGDIAEADVQTVGTDLQYTGVVLNGNGTDPNAAHPFLKVQEQAGSGSFEYAGCYLGNNSSAGSFGLSFFALSQPFASAHMRATRSGSSVRIDLTNVNGGSLANQSYVCDGAPTPPGDKIGVHDYTDGTATLDNFGNGSSVLDTFSFSGTLASSGRWTDAAPGMHANGSKALGGSTALSFFTGSGLPQPTLSSISPSSGRAGRTVFITLTGTNFAPGSTTVNVSGSGITVVPTPGPDGTSTTTTQTVRFAIASSGAGGNHDVTVTTAGGTSNALTFSVSGADVPMFGQ